MIILLIIIHDYSINDYYWILINIILVAIGDYYINGYW
jgi:hypothetical protein